MEVKQEAPLRCHCARRAKRVIPSLKRVGSDPDGSQPRSLCRTGLPSLTLMAPLASTPQTQASEFPACWKTAPPCSSLGNRNLILVGEEHPRESFVHSFFQHTQGWCRPAAGPS